MAGNKMTNASTITKRKRFKRAKDKKDEDAQIKPSYEMDQRDPVTRGLTSNSFDPRGVNSTSTRGLNNSNAKNFYTRGSDGARETVRRRPGKKSYSNFDAFCSCTSLHGWKYLSKSVNRSLRASWFGIVLASMGVAGFFLGYSINDFLSSKVQTTQDTSRASLDNVFFPSVTLCNINQGRRSFFLQNGLDSDTKLLNSVLGQAYFGLEQNLSTVDMEKVRRLFSSEEVIRKGIFTDLMYMNTTSKAEASMSKDPDWWEEQKDLDFIRDAGWYFKTLAAQEPGENYVLFSSYGKILKDPEEFSDLLPFFGTDYGLCSLIKPQISFNRTLSLTNPFASLMKTYTTTIKPGIQLGKENGLTLLLDAEVYDYAFSPQRGEGFKLAIHGHKDQPIMALSDIDLSPGFVTQLSVTPTLRDTTEAAKWRFSPEERGCYFDDELTFKYLPNDLYRYGLSNCLFAATYDQILTQCKCVPYFHTMAYDVYPHICSGTSLRCMNMILRDIGSHTHVTDKDGRRRPCLFACKDQSYTTSVTTSTFPNMHTFLRGPEFCLMLRKLRTSCETSKRFTLEEQYPELCSLIKKFPKLCQKILKKMTEEEEIEIGKRSQQNKSDMPKSSTETTKKTSKTTATTPTTASSTITTSGYRFESEKDETLPDVAVLKTLFAEQESEEKTTQRKTLGLRLMKLLHTYAKENLLVTNIYIKDPAVTLIKRDQKIPVIWFVANVGGILGLSMGCSLVTLFEVAHHILQVFLKTGKRSVNKLTKTIRIHKNPSMDNLSGAQQKTQQSEITQLPLTSPPTDSHQSVKNHVSNGTESGRDCEQLQPLGLGNGQVVTGTGIINGCSPLGIHKRRKTSKNNSEDSDSQLKIQADSVDQTQLIQTSNRE